MTLYDELIGVLGALDDAGIDYALVGALAVAVWGAPRATKDIDLLVRPEDLPRAMTALAATGFTLEGLPFQFKDGTQVQRVNKVDPAGNLMTGMKARAARPQDIMDVQNLKDIDR